MSGLSGVSLGERAISPLSASPWAAKCIRLTEVICSSTACFVALSPTRGAVPTSLPTISASFLAHGSGDSQPTLGLPTISAPLLL